MKIKDIDDWDYFKGDFKSKPKEKSKATSGNALIHYQGLFGQQTTGVNSSGPLTYEDIVIAAGKMIESSIVYGNYYFLFDENAAPQYIEYSKVHDPSRCATIKGFNMDEQSCEHDPIDVGFAKPKMVCRKCDEDL